MFHTPTLQVVGLDERAWQRGQRDGTMLVDLVAHRLVDLLPDRAAASVAAWLAQHPTITVHESFAALDPETLHRCLRCVLKLGKPAGPCRGCDVPSPCAVDDAGGAERDHGRMGLLMAGAVSHP